MTIVRTPSDVFGSRPLYSTSLTPIIKSMFLRHLSAVNWTVINLLSGFFFLTFIRLDWADLTTNDRTKLAITSACLNAGRCGTSDFFIFYYFCRRRQASAFYPALRQAVKRYLQPLTASWTGSCKFYRY
ncbi:MAG: hypothetical protein POELPBGB_03924 [Bacteroidia bacterium]|nr:hypothetical protein [Bacteroidia bacterium]